MSVISLEELSHLPSKRGRTHRTRTEEYCLVFARTLPEQNEGRGEIQYLLNSMPRGGSMRGVFAVPVVLSAASVWDSHTSIRRVVPVSGEVFMKIRLLHQSQLFPYNTYHYAGVYE